MARGGDKQSVSIRRALEIARDRHQAGDLAGAGKLCDDILAQQPELTAALHLKGLVLFQRGDRPAGVALLERGAKLTPGDYQLQFNLARMLRALNRTEDAVAALEAALAIDGTAPEPRDTLVEVLRALGRHEHNRGRLHASMRTLRRALELAPEDPKAHFQLAECLLLCGALARGFEEYEWRWRIEDFPNKPQDLARPFWDGGPLEGKTILIHPEQGLGDSIQFCRYIPLLKQRGATTLMAGGPALTRLLGSLEGLDRIVGLSERLPAFDCHAPTLSLPRLFGTRLETIPGRTPYLAPDPAGRARWAERLSGLTGLRVGVAWGGSAKHPNDKRRSIDPALLAPLVDLPGTSWVSLQTAERRDELAAFAGRGAAAGIRAAGSRAAGGLLDITDDLGDFAETAAIVANLDLVVCIDTALGHLAGAIGCPVWLLLSQPPDWRWMMGSVDSPWYPRHRLFRQPVREDWPPVIEALRLALIERVAAGERD